MLKNAMKAIHQRCHLHHFEMAGSILILMLIIVCDLGVGRSDPRSVELLFRWLHPHVAGPTSSSSFEIPHAAVNRPVSGCG
jgi:hypothetical protein